MCLQNATSKRRWDKTMTTQQHREQCQFRRHAGCKSLQVSLFTPMCCCHCTAGKMSLAMRLTTHELRFWICCLRLTELCQSPQRPVLLSIIINNLCKFQHDGGLDPAHHSLSMRTTMFITQLVVFVNT